MMRPIVNVTNNTWAQTAFYTAIENVI